MTDQPVIKRGPGRPPKIQPPVVKEETIMSNETNTPETVAYQRPPMRPDDPLTAAKKRAEEIRAQRGGSLDDGVDRFNAPTPPEGWSYEWRVQSVFGVEDPSKTQALLSAGWEPVPTSRHPEMMPGRRHEAHITRDGMALMQRPKDITDEYRQIERDKAVKQMRNKKEQLGQAKPGEFERDHPGTRPLVRSEYMAPIPVPRE